MSKSRHHPFDPLTPLFAISANDIVTLGESYEGFLILGATGSGKTSTSGAQLALRFLSLGLGGLVLTAKPDETALWKRYAQATGRSADLVLFGPDHAPEFNFLNYEMTREGPGAGDTETIVDVFMHVVEASGKQSGHGNGDAFWTHSAKQMLRNAIDLVYYARGTVGLHEIKDVIKSAPQSRAEAHSEDWQKHSFCYRLIEEAEKNARTDYQQRDFDESVDYWLEQFPALADKTRSIIVVMFTSMADYFLRGKLHRLFCKGLTLRPEDTMNGKIILLDLPVKEYHDRGRFAQILFKYIWQRAIERRDTRQNPRPVFLWADEAPIFSSVYDIAFQSTARSSRASTVYLAQNLPGFAVSYGGGDTGAALAKALTGNLSTKIFHANTDVETNQWAADLIGKDWQTRVNTNLNTTPADTLGALFGQSQPGASAGTSEAFEYQLPPNVFKRQRTGGHRHQLLVDVVIIQNGRQWASGEDFLRLTFKQQ
jgi:hypothetical protein